MSHSSSSPYMDPICSFKFTQTTETIYFQHNGQLKVKYSHTKNWFPCFATIRINENRLRHELQLRWEQWLNHISWFLTVSLWFFPKNIHPIQLTTQFIQHITKYMQKISRNKISSPRWVSHPTLSNLHKEQI